MVFLISYKWWCFYVKLIKNAGCELISGWGKMIGPNTVSITKSNNEISNSAILINTDGKILSSYDKIHLVPFGEYLPFSEYIKKFEPFMGQEKSYLKLKDINKINL